MRHLSVIALAVSSLALPYDHRLVLFAATAAFAPGASAQASASELECDPGGTQQQLNACALTAYERLDAELNRKYKELLALLPPQEQRKLRAAQRTWIRKRDATCEAKVGAKDYSMKAMLYFDCMERLTGNRTWELENLKPAR